jgi:hypothetical protein
MEAIKKTAEFINYLDFEPKRTIVVKPFDGGLIKVCDYEDLYGINSKIDNSIFSDEAEILDLSVKSVRIRAQRELSLKTFAFIDEKEVGPLKKVVESALAYEDYSLEIMDAQIVSVVACKFFNISKGTLPLIKKIITLDAPDIVKVTETLSVKI